MDGLHKGIVSEELWQAAQVKIAAQAKKYEKVNPVPNAHVHLLTTLIKCPLCGAGMYGNKSTTRRKDSERQELMQALIAEIHIHEQPQPNGQWLKSIKFRLPIIDGDTSLVLDKCDGVETVVLMSRKDT